MTAEFAKKVADHAANIIAGMNKEDRDFILALPLEQQVTVVAAMMATAA